MVGWDRSVTERWLSGGVCLQHRSVTERLTVDRMMENNHKINTISMFHLLSEQNPERHRHTNGNNIPKHRMGQWTALSQSGQYSFCIPVSNFPLLHDGFDLLDIMEKQSVGWVGHRSLLQIETPINAVE